MMLKLLNQVSANAELHIDAEPEDLRIIHMASYTGVRVDSFFPRAHGRSSPKRREKVNVEIVVEKIIELEG
jgi:large subunit ribosomal protein L22